MIQGETLLRVAAVGGAVALLAAPYAAQFATLARRAFVLVRTHWTLAARVAAAALIIAAAWGRIPLPAVPAAVPVIVVETPTRELQALVAPISKTLGRLPVAERAAWMSVWSKAAAVVDNPGTVETRIFTDTPALRLFTVVALDIAWRRLGGHAPGSVAGLREAVESALQATLGTEAVPVTAELRGRYADVARAIAWAGNGVTGE